MSKEKCKGDIMPIVIERIISIERAETDAFMKRQNKRLERLRAMEQRKRDGKRVDTKPIIEGLQKAGILDKHGNLASPYRDEE